MIISDTGPAEASFTADSFALPDGSEATVRPIRGDDRDALISFHRQLSEKTVYFRYFSPVSLDWRTDSRRLADELCNAPAHQTTLVVERRCAGSGNREIVGVGRLVAVEPDGTGDFGIAIRDSYQGMGLGRMLMMALIATARRRGMSQLKARVLHDNRRMIELCRSLGFRLDTGEEPSVVLAVLPL